MKILRQYQLDIIFLFFAILLLVWSSFYGLKFFGADPHRYELYIAGPLLLLFVAILTKIRSKIKIHERRALTGKTLFYWIALGVSLFFTYSTPIAAKEYLSVEILYILFTLFLADSYWDFKKLSWKNIKKDNN